MAPQPKIESKINDVTEPVVSELSALEHFTINHPRTAKVVGIAAITAVTLGGIAGWKAHKLKVDKTEAVPVVVVPVKDESKTA